MEYLAIGVDPGITTGIAALGYEKSFSLLTYYQVHSEELDHATGAEWWKICAEVGGELAVECWEIVENFLRVSDDSGIVGLFMEDFVLSPTKMVAGAIGRDAITPVAIGAVLFAQFGAMCSDMGVRLAVSPPSAKAVINPKTHRVFKECDVPRGRPHAKDALIHAILGIRHLRKG